MMSFSSIFPIYSKCWADARRCMSAFNAVSPANIFTWLLARDLLRAKDEPLFPHDSTRYNRRAALHSFSVICRRAMHALLLARSRLHRHAPWQRRI
ncbi:Polyhydroxyalkanoic acid synthase [Paraburkholderia unamae]|nr:Polyhydroxyalkanoic acid synthase [Paraburkholderia unamae]